MKDKLMKYLSIFFLGSLVGYIYEVIFYFLIENRLDNAGLLFGPWLPIYGIGALLITFMSKYLKNKPIICFFSIMLITGILEYSFGYLGLNIFHIRLWDYRGLFLNINGFVCLRSVLTFALGGIFLIYIIEPFLNKVLKKYNHLISYILIFIIILFIIDIILSIILKRTPYLY